MNWYNQYRFSDKINSPEDIMGIMSKINYGYITKNRQKIDKIKDNEFYTNWFLQSPKELLESEIGVCWDQVELERSLFNKLNFDYKTIYIELEHGNSHTFLTFKEDDKWYWFEHSYGKYKGIHGPFNKIDDIVKKVVLYMQKEEDGKDSPLVFYTEYDKPNSGIGCQEFMDHCGKSNSLK